jgi:hypothetical protein
MKTIIKALTFGAMLAASSTLAYASPLSGTVVINGGVGAITPAVLNSGTTGITFAAIPDELTEDGTGSFTPAVLGGFLNGVEIATFPTTFTIPNTSGNPFPGEVLLTFDVSGTPDSFTVTSVTTAANGSLFFYGTLGSNPGNATYILTPDQSGNGSFSGTLTVTPTPEPSSLILFGTGLMSAAGLMVRKRRAVTA